MNTDEKTKVEILVITQIININIQISEGILSVQRLSVEFRLKMFQSHNSFADKYPSIVSRQTRAFIYSDLFTHNSFPKQKYL